MDYRTLQQQLTGHYGEREAYAVARLALEMVCGLSFADVCAGKDRQLSPHQQARLQEIALRLCGEKP